MLLTDNRRKRHEEKDYPLCQIQQSEDESDGDDSVECQRVACEVPYRVVSDGNHDARAFVGFW